jgi:hypothetical protein
LDFWGVPEEARPPEVERVFYVEPENWDVVRLYMAMQTQWALSPTGHRIGLNYSSIQPTARFIGVKVTPQVFNDLQLMEITHINESYKK